MDILFVALVMPTWKQSKKNCKSVCRNAAENSRSNITRSWDPWRRWIDTALKAPHDIVPWREAAPVPGPTYRAGARSVVALYAPVD